MEFLLPSGGFYSPAEKLFAAIRLGNFENLIHRKKICFAQKLSALFKTFHELFLLAFSFAVYVLNDLLV